jgi:hypothetical protein
MDKNLSLWICSYNHFMIIVDRADFMMWIMIREVGRYSVVTGKSIFDGFSSLSGKSQFPIWLVFTAFLFVWISSNIALA